MDITPETALREERRHLKSSIDSRTTLKGLVNAEQNLHIKEILQKAIREFDAIIFYRLESVNLLEQYLELPLTTQEK